MMFFVWEAGGVEGPRPTDLVGTRRDELRSFVLFEGNLAIQKTCFLDYDCDSNTLKNPWHRVWAQLPDSLDSSIR